MRTILFTGKGGVGKTTAAAGTATLAARAGRRTLVMSTDAAHSLGDALGVAPELLGPEPVELEPRLWVQQVDAQRRFEQSWSDVQRYLLAVLDAGGVDPVTAEELTVVPGVEEVLALLELREHLTSRRWDVVVVDCAPTAETLRLLALPEALGWYLERVLPLDRRLVRVLLPVLGQVAGSGRSPRLPVPEDSVLDAVRRLHDDLALVRRLLTEPDATVRLVLTPESVVLAEARRSLTTLGLFGYRVDGVIANRVFPEGGDDPWRAGWVAAQRPLLGEVVSSFAPVPVWRADYLAAEPVGTDALAGFAAGVYAGADPFAVPSGPGPVVVERSGDLPVLRVALPFAGREDVDLARHGDELVVTVGSYRRVLALPAGLVRHDVVGARVEDGALLVRFRSPAAAGDERGEAAQ